MLYHIKMRKAISVTLGADNVLWLKGQAARTGKGSVSEVLDRLVAEARTAGKTTPEAIKSVVGTVDLPDDDPDLSSADAYIRSVFASSARQPHVVRERAKPHRKSRRG